MAILKNKEIIKMKMSEINEKLKELKIEMIKLKANTKKAGKGPKEIKKTIARMLTFKTMNKINNIKNKQNGNNKSEVKK